MLELARDTRQFLNCILGLLGTEGAAQLAQIKREKVESSELGSKGFGGSNSDLGTGMGVDSPPGLAGNHRAHHIANRHRLGAFGFRFSLGSNGVRRLT